MCPQRLYFDQMGSIPQSVYHYLVYPHRLYFDQMGGIELDVFGARKRRWLWKDQETHVHAPPFQPICLRLNHNNSVRVMTQEAIALTFRASKRSCRFTVGARLKVRLLLCLMLPLCWCICLSAVVAFFGPASDCFSLSLFVCFDKALQFWNTVLFFHLTKSPCSCSRLSLFRNNKISFVPCHFSHNYLLPC